MTAEAKRRWMWWVGLVGATVAAYGPALGGGYVWDDDGHVTRAELGTVGGLWRIWTEVGATQQYYPVLHSAFWVEHRVWGDAALGYHLANVILHSVAAGLFGLVLLRLLGDGGTAQAGPGEKGAEAWGIGLAAAFVFALHPVGVETVAWISEQKNTLSTVFYLLAALAYLGRPAAAPAGAWMASARYWLATGLFVLALLSKSVTATLPAALLVAVWWRDGRLSWRRDVLPLGPWFGAALGSGLFTAWVERTYIGARGGHFGLDALQRVLLAGRVVWFYLGKLIWPANLVFIYPRWTVDAGQAAAWLYPAGLVVLLGAAWMVRGRSRAPLAALLFFVGTLFPALGFIDVYPFVFSYVADHFQYLASLGVIALAAGGWSRSRRRLGAAATAVLAVLLLLLATLTWRQSRNYRDSETLFRATVERNPSSWLAQENLGVLLANQGRLDEAAGHYREALRLNPDYAETHANYANALVSARRWAEAAAEYRKALGLRPDFLPAAANWAQAEYAWASELGNGGHLAEAMVHYGEALRLRPDYPEAMAELGLAEAYSGRLAEAIGRLKGAVRLRPGFPQAHAYLGFALAEAGHPAEAVDEYRESLRLNPRDGDVHYQLAMALKALGRTAAAAEELEAARQSPGAGR